MKLTCQNCAWIQLYFQWFLRAWWPSLQYLMTPSLWNTTIIPADKNVTPTSLTDRQIQYLEARNTADTPQRTIPYIMQVLQNQSHVILWFGFQNYWQRVWLSTGIFKHHVFSSINVKILVNKCCSGSHENMLYTNNIENIIPR
jgi:hypothetical protein